MTKPVSFRLDEYLFGRLAELAAPKGMSVHEVAREIVREALTDPLAQRTLARMAQLETRLAELHSRVAVLHQSMRHATYTVLCQLGSNEEVAERFVNEHMAE